MAQSGIAKRKKGVPDRSNADKSRAVAAYGASGSFSRASAITGIPENTIRYWAKQEWWQEEIRRVDRADTEELKGTFTRIAKKASEELEDRLERGDEVIGKDGTLLLKKIPGKELAIIAAVAADKRKQALDQPNTVAIQNSTEKLAGLLMEFMKFQKTKTIRGEVIDAEQQELQEGLHAGEAYGDPATQEGAGNAQPSSPDHD